MKYIILVLTTIVLVWVIFVTLTPFLVSEFFYSIETAKVAEIRQDEVLLIFTRYARFAMTARYTSELQCNLLFQFGEAFGVLEAGHNTFIQQYPLPENAHGDCRYRGSITYEPFGQFGPPFTTYWESAQFSIQRHEAPREEPCGVPDG